MDTTENSGQRCWITLVTQASYLPGVIILAYSLDRVKSKYPLVVQYTSSLGCEAIAALKGEAEARDRIILDPVDLLVPRQGQENVAIVAERFRDTFTKLRAFEVYKSGFTKACFLDADMAVMKNPDSIFDTALPNREWIGANHPCVCNLDRNEWAPSFWNKGNCAYTTLTEPNEIFDRASNDNRPTYQLLNGGMFMFYPTRELWDKMITNFTGSDKLKNYQFPDQDFLADFFVDKVQALSWKFNALKTMRYWHPCMWSDQEVAIVHYIVDKPWERRLSPAGVAGHLGRDGETHRWWRNLYADWLRSQTEHRDTVLSVMLKLVDTQEPFTKVVPLSQEPGKPEDVVPYTQD